MARAASGPGRPGPSTQCRRPQEDFRARPGLRVLGLRRAAARSAGAYRTGWSRAPGTAVRAPEADPRQVPGLRVPGPGSFLSAGPVLPSPSSPSGLVAPGRCPTSIPHTLSTHYVPGPPGRRARTAPICPARLALCSARFRHDFCPHYKPVG